MKVSIIRLLSLSVFVLGIHTMTGAQEIETGQHAKVFQKAVATTLSYKYLLYIPGEYNTDEREWPLIVFLHGAGERGDDLRSVMTHGLPKMLKTRTDFPFIVVSPQCPDNEWWHAETLRALLDEVFSLYRIDHSRVYLTGLSMGGYGTWETAARFPQLFAAIAPICGGGNILQAWRLKAMPIWVFHGAKDDTVPISQSQMMVDYLKDSKAEVKFTVYPDAGHDSWTATYDNPELYTWFLNYQKIK